jgi:hypothetical protein
MKGPMHFNFFKLYGTVALWASFSSLNSGQIAVCGTRGKDAVHGGNSVEHVGLT